MNVVHTAVNVWFACNILVFVVAALRSFDGRFVTWKTRASGLSFIACAALSAAALSRAPEPPLRLALFALAILAVSSAVFASAFGAMRSRPLTAIGSEDAPVHVLRCGVYAYVRHPFYLSYILTFVAACIASQAAVCVLALAYITALYASAARAEEKKFAGTNLADQYASYAAQTGMLLPRPFARRTS